MRRHAISHDAPSVTLCARLVQRVGKIRCVTLDTTLEHGDCSLCRMLQRSAVRKQNDQRNA